MSTLKQDRKHLRDKDLGRHSDRKYREALKVITSLEKEVDAYKAVSVPPSKRVIKRIRGDSSVAQATAIAVASDWHVEELVKPSTVQYMNEYNPDIAERRAQRFWQKVILLTNRNRSDTKIDNLVLVLLGDFISGSIHEELLENSAMQPMEAIMFVQELLNSGITFLKENGDFKSIIVICKDGNHGRMGYAGSKIRNATRTGNSLEWAMYQNLSKQHTDLKWIVEDSVLTYYKVYGEVIRCMHGDKIRYLGGVGGLEVPLKRAILQWDQTEQADINLLGHFHQYMPGYTTVNGSLIGYNAYALGLRFKYQPPMQTFILLDPKRGITVHSPILVSNR